MSREDFIIFFFSAVTIFSTCMESFCCEHSALGRQLCLKTRRLFFEAVEVTFTLVQNSAMPGLNRALLKY